MREHAQEKRTTSSGKSKSVQAGNIFDISGNVNVAGGNITTHHTSPGLSASEIKQLFDGLYTKIETRLATPTADKEDLKAK